MSLLKSVAIINAQFSGPGAFDKAMIIVYMRMV